MTLYSSTNYHKHFSINNEMIRYQAYKKMSATWKNVLFRFFFFFFVFFFFVCRITFISGLATVEREKKRYIFRIWRPTTERCDARKKKSLWLNACPNHSCQVKEFIPGMRQRNEYVRVKEIVGEGKREKSTFNAESESVIFCTSVTFLCLSVVYFCMQRF